MAPAVVPYRRAAGQQLRGKHPQPQALTSKLFSFLTHVALLALWKALTALALPIGKVIALNLWLGKSVLTLSIHLQHQVGFKAGAGLCA